MLKGESIICGTSSTGTGTLNLAATPTPPGGVDFDVLARATGNGFANSAAILVTYTIIEYTDSYFANAKSMEKGIGTLTLGGSSGIANCTLARTTPQVTATSLNSQPATYNTNGPSAINIGTAANTLIFIGPSATDSLEFSSYYETSLGDALGVHSLSSQNSGGTIQINTDVENFWSFYWGVPMLAKKASMRVSTLYTGGTTNAYFRIYAVGSNGRPGKLLIDFGVLATAGSSLVATGNVSTAVHSTGFFMTPGRYIASFYASFSGGSGTPRMLADLSCWYDWDWGSLNMQGQMTTKATSPSNPAPDPANSTGYALDTFTSVPTFVLSPS